GMFSRWIIGNVNRYVVHLTKFDVRSWRPLYILVKFNFCTTLDALFNTNTKFQDPR
ncbi:hypothetical protein L9F63_004213, partial [Diploptera punctata]